MSHSGGDGDDRLLELRALEHGLALRAPETVGGIAAAVTRWTRDAGGVLTARVRLSDGTSFGWLDVVVSDGATPPREAMLEPRVEELAATFAAGERLAALSALRLAWSLDGELVVD